MAQPRSYLERLQPSTSQLSAVPEDVDMVSGSNLTGQAMLPPPPRRTGVKPPAGTQLTPEALDESAVCEQLLLSCCLTSQANIQSTLSSFSNTACLPGKKTLQQQAVLAAAAQSGAVGTLGEIHHCHSAS